VTDLRRRPLIGSVRRARPWPWQPMPGRPALLSGRTPYSGLVSEQASQWGPLAGQAAGQDSLVATRDRSPAGRQRSFRSGACPVAGRFCPDRSYERPCLLSSTVLGAGASTEVDFRTEAFRDQPARRGLSGRQWGVDAEAEQHGCGGPGSRPAGPRFRALERQSRLIGRRASRLMRWSRSPLADGGQTAGHDQDCAR
jgi:hypothetical protein